MSVFAVGGLLVIAFWSVIIDCVKMIMHMLLSTHLWNISSRGNIITIRIAKGAEKGSHRQFNIVRNTFLQKCQQRLFQWNSCSAGNTSLLNLNTELAMDTSRSKFHKLNSVTTNNLRKWFTIKDYSLAKQATQKCVTGVTSFPFVTGGEVPQRQSDAIVWTSRWSSVDYQQWVSSSWLMRAVTFSMGQSDGRVSSEALTSLS